MLVFVCDSLRTRSLRVASRDETDFSERHSGQSRRKGRRSLLERVQRDKNNTSPGENFTEEDGSDISIQETEGITQEPTPVEMVTHSKSRSP